MEEALTVFAVDANASARKLYNRLSKNWFMSIWFVLLAVAMTWGSLVLASTISRDVTLRASDLVIEPNTFLLFIYLLLTGKSIVDSLHRAVESKELVHLMVQPVSPAQIAFGKFLGVLFSNLAIVAFGAGLMASIQLSSFYITPEHPLTITGPMPDGSGNSWWNGYGITHLQVLDTILLAIIASCMGFTYSILNSLALKKRILGILVYSQLVSSIFIVMRWNQDLKGENGPMLLPVQETIALFVILLAAFAVLYPTVKYLFFEAWLKETSGKRAMWFQKRSWGGLAWVGRLFTPRMAQLIKKELIINVQKKEIAGNIIAILGLSALLVWGWQKIEGLEQVPKAAQQLAYPAIISVGIYLAAILQCGFMGLGSVGKEGRKFWLLKSLPVHHEKVFTAKAWSILALSPITILGVALPLPLILNYGWSWVLFFILMAIAVIMAFTGIGLLMGARYPNFDESVGGMPDVMSMYILMLICLGVSGGMFIFAGYALAGDLLGGLLSTFVCLEVGFILLVIGIRGGGWIYSRTEPHPT